GYLLLFAGNFTMYFGKYQPSHVKGWHIMNISDVADDGTVTVISWGRIYTMKMSDMRSNFHFVYVKYLNT
uniref:hypothetical protein n=1 Tax=Acetatifactor sp. TaxID=1872090 RepID=UPI0040569DE5